MLNRRFLLSVTTMALAATGAMGGTARADSGTGTFTSSTTGAVFSSGYITASNGAVTVDLSGATSPIIDGSSYVFSKSSLFTAVSSATNATGLFKFSKSTNGSGDVILTVSKTPLASVVMSPGTKPIAIALNALEGAATSSGQSLAIAVQLLPSVTEIDKAVRQLAPSASLGAAQVSGAMAATQANVNAIGARTVQVRTAESSGATGFAAGGETRGLGVWAQGLGYVGRQERRQDQDGYDAATGGVAFGLDGEVRANLRLGGALSYARTHVASTGDSTGNSVDVNSYQATLYANYQGKPWQADATLVYGRHQYDSVRAIRFSGFTADAKSDYAGDQITAQVSVGYPKVIGNAMVTPSVSLAYGMLIRHAYDESGAAGANLSVDEQTSHSIRSGLGVKIAKSYSRNGARLQPEIRLAWHHEFEDGAPETTARFSAGGSSFTSSGAAAAADSAVIGLGLTFIQANDLKLTASYDGEVKDRYFGHTATLQARWDF